MRRRLCASLQQLATLEAGTCAALVSGPPCARACTHAHVSAVTPWPALHRWWSQRMRGQPGAPRQACQAGALGGRGQRRWHVTSGWLAAREGQRGNGRLLWGRRHVKGDPANMHYINITHKPVVNLSFTNPDPDSPASGACTINGYLYRCAAPVTRSHSCQRCATAAAVAPSTAAAQGLVRLQRVHRPGHGVAAAEHRGAPAPPAHAAVRGRPSPSGPAARRCRRAEKSPLRNQAAPLSAAGRAQVPDRAHGQPRQLLHLAGGRLSACPMTPILSVDRYQEGMCAGGA